LLLSGERFDAIVSQPSHPWSPGASLLYTQEFFEIARDHLSPDGVMVQWMGLQFIDEELFASILATLTSVFDHVRVYSPPPGAAALFLASNSPLDTEAAAARALAADPEAFAPLGLRLPEHVTAALVLDEQGVAALAAGATPIRDDNNPLQTRAGRQKRVEGRWQRLFAQHDPFARAVPPHSDPFALIASVPPPRAGRLADSVTDPKDRTTARGLAAISQRKPVTARRAFEQVLAQDPRDRRARAALLGMDRRKIELGEPAENIIAPPLSSAERAIVAGWVEGPDSARERDVDLARIGPRAPFAREARWQRAEWRIRSGDPALAREAVALADEIVANRRENRALLLRARALAAAGEETAALQMLIVIGDQTKRRAPPRGALALARGIPDRPEIAELRAHTLQILQSRPAGRGAPAS
jgi:hypothetical protein